MKVILLKPFVFSYPPSNSSRITRSLPFTPSRDQATKNWIPTEMDIPDDVWAHEWVSEQFADGCIERPELTQARIDAVAERQAKEVAENKKILRAAEAALARSSRASAVRGTGSAALDKELNTPVNELQGQRGQDIDKAALDKELNTPVNELQAKQA